MTRVRRPPTSPAQVIALSFLVMIAVGALVLALPVAHAPGQHVGLLDALFTATSAVCVTGLAVVDTGSAYSRFGQVVIMLLFQLGGIGLLTLGTFLAFATGRRVGFSERIRLQAQINTLETGGILNLLRAIILLVLSSELLGTALLYIPFARLEGWGEGLFYALFHSISAFNNAGFSLYADSLTRFVTDPLVNFTIMALIILGGLGFVVITELLARLRPRWRRPLSLHTRLVLTITLFLLASATVIIFLLEFANPATLGALELPGKLLASLFQAVTPRTAGFNTLDYASMEPATLLFTTLLMFIGGNPGSTAGGIKTVTFFVLVASIWSVVRRRGELELYGRRMTQNTVVRAGVIAFSGLLLAGGALTLLTISERDTDLMLLLFETASAFGTAGLSLGITGDLSVLGKCVMIGLMYLGRIGLLTFALALVAEHSAGDIRHPAEDVVIG